MLTAMLLISLSQAPVSDVEKSQPQAQPGQGLRLAELRFSALSGLDLFSVSVSVTALLPFDVEAGYVPLAVIECRRYQGPFSQVYLRGGYRAGLIDTRVDGHGSLLELAELVGVRATVGSVGGPCGYCGGSSDRPLGFDVVAAVSFTFFYARHFALHLQLAVGGALWVIAGAGAAPLTDVTGRPERVSDFFSPEARFAMGVAF